MSVYDYVDEDMERRIGVVKVTLATFRSALRKFRRRAPDAPLTYEVRLLSLWSDKGEKSIELVAQGELPELIKRAEVEYMSINKRGDIQAIFSISVVLVPGVTVSLPDRFFIEYTENFKKRPLAIH